MAAQRGHRTAGTIERPKRWFPNWLLAGGTKEQAVRDIEGRIRALASVNRRFRRLGVSLGTGELALVTLAAHCLRASELAESALECFRADRRLAAMSLTRGVFESLALLAYLNHQISEIAEGNLKADASTHEAIGTLLFGMRHKHSGGFDSKNILTMMDKLDRKHSGTRDVYDRLCEYTHPNMPGALGAYLAFAKDNRTVLRLREKSLNIAPEDVVGPLYYSCVLMMHEAARTPDLVRQGSLLNREQARRLLSAPRR